VRSYADVRRALHERREQQGISCESSDALVGFSSGYTAKILSASSRRRMLATTLCELMTAYGLVAEIVEDPEYRLRHEPRNEAAVIGARARHRMRKGQP
jgi:hypothetical protein